MSKSGTCYLVGAGPGDLGLVTLRAKECIEFADVLVYDALSSPELLNWTKAGCEKIYVGKRAKDHALPQDQINALIVQRTKEGKKKRKKSRALGKVHNPVVRQRVPR